MAELQNLIASAINQSLPPSLSNFFIISIIEVTDKMSWRAKTYENKRT
jgi:hypothetical protein